MKFTDLDFEYDEFEPPTSDLEITIEFELPFFEPERIIADTLKPNRYIFENDYQEKELGDIDLERHRQEYQDSINLFKIK